MFSIWHDILNAILIFIGIVIVVGVLVGFVCIGESVIFKMKLQAIKDTYNIKDIEQVIRIIKG